MEARFRSRGVCAAPTERRLFARIKREERALVNRLIEEAVAGNAFHFQSAQERRAAECR